ncbi:MAG: hypothetical protein IIA92_13720 [Chloroflexi bacterium]|nr:hypothetical protein [Chloroflexota bacterium]
MTCNRDDALPGNNCPFPYEGGDQPSPEVTPERMALWPPQLQRMVQDQIDAGNKVELDQDLEGKTTITITVG